MTTIQDIQNANVWRYAVKNFIKGEKVESEKLEAIIEAGRMAPGAYGLQPYKLIHVVDTETREKLKEASFGQTKVTDAGDFFVVAVRTDIDNNFVDEYVKNISDTRGVEIGGLKGFADNMKGDIVTRDDNNKFAWAGRMGYISFGFILETAAMLGVDVGPMEGFVPAKYDEVLGLGQMNLKSVGAFAVGVRDSSDVYATLKKVRISKDDFVIIK
jgi:nitroreductase